jgi:hypothetical protein
VIAYRRPRSVEAEADAFLIDVLEQIEARGRMEPVLAGLLAQLRAPSAASSRS